MADVPKVVVITRTRNRPILLRRAMESVLGQKFTDWQHVIVNDGGDKDAVESLADTFKEAYAGRLLLIHQAQQGMQKAANSGIQQSDSTFVTIHDDDDSWHPEFLQRTTAFLNRSGVESPYQGVICKTLRILEAEQEDGTFKEIEQVPYMPLNEINLFRIGYDNPFSPIAFLYRRSVHETIGFFDPRWDMVADMDFNFRFLQHFEIGVVDKPLAYYHWRDEKASRANANTVTKQKARHGRYLNELKNHYLRKAESAREAAIALGLQVSAYAVENQWMTVEIREKTMETHLFLENLLQKIQALQEFNTEALWPKVTEDLITRLEEVQKALRGFEDIKGQLSSLQGFNVDSTWPKLAALSKTLDSMSERIEELQAGHADSLEQGLAQLQAFNHDALWPKLLDLQNSIVPLLVDLQNNILPKLDELRRSQTDQLAGIEASLNPRLESLQSFNGKLWNKLGDLQASGEALWPKLVSHEESLQNLHGEVAATWNKQVEAHTSLEQLREEVRALKEDQKRQWQLGRLRLQWLPRIRKSGPTTSEA